MNFTFRSISLGACLFGAAVAVGGTALSLLPYEAWWVRVFDFPRYQLAAVSLLSLGGLLALRWPMRSRKALRATLCIALFAATTYQIYRIFPYTPMHSVMSKQSASQEGGADQVSVMVVNVYIHNEQYQRCIDEIRQVSPDIVLAMETDQKWVDALDALTDLYPERVAEPLENAYGMVLYSRLPLSETEVRYLIQDDIPSIRTRVRLPGGSSFLFYGLHPRPPAPQESDSSLPRDVELVVVATEIAELQKDHAEAVIVAGDMNDVAWSDTTQLFLKISRTLDPRVGRGLFNTFHVDVPPLRVPLDHVFHTEDFKLSSMRRLDDVGSDHFPMYIRLSLEPERDLGQNKLELEEEDIEKAERKLEEAEAEGVEEEGNVEEAHEELPEE